MKVGDLVKTKCGQLCIIKQYRPELEGHSNFNPWIVYLINNNWKIDHFKFNELEVVNELELLGTKDERPESRC